MELENKSKQTEATSITFKLAPDERQKILDAAEFLDVNLSEYCRIKCLADEKTVFDQAIKSAELEKENKVLKVKLAYYKESERDPNSVVLQLTSEQKEILEKLYSDKINWGDRTMDQKILVSLRIFFTSPQNWEGLFKEYSDGVTIEEIEEHFD
ncbi:MAG: hypothetical protein POELPBGB_00801 [Bacteroidia bacterium]|nr:hypothetical protein [Bacteroidia bacterium]